MFRTKIVETVEEFDEDGKLVKKTTTETEETDDNPARHNTTITPAQTPWDYKPFRFGTISQVNNEKG